eukprot:369966_1
MTQISADGKGVIESYLEEFPVELLDDITYNNGHVGAPIVAVIWQIWTDSSASIILENNTNIDGISSNDVYILANGINLLTSTITNDLMITNSTFIENNITNSITNIDGISSLQLYTMMVSDNTALNGVLFDGVGNGNVDIQELQFTKHNYVDSLIDGENLMQFNNFIDFTVQSCYINMNGGEYLFNAILTGDIQMNDCIIDNNDIDEQSIISITANGGSLAMSSSSITNNKNDNSGFAQSITSLININNTGNVSLSSINIKDNYATQYIVFDGASSGNLEMENIQIMDNDNDIPSIRDTLIEMNNFKTGIISNSNFTNNNGGSNLFVASFDGNLDIMNVEFMNNDINNTLIEMKGISTLTINTITTSDNTATNGMLFNGLNSGDINLNNFIFNNNNIQKPLDGETLIEFTQFNDLNVDQCQLNMNDGDYLFNAVINGDIQITNCIIDNNDIDDTIINIIANGGSLD